MEGALVKTGNTVGATATFTLPCSLKKNSKSTSWGGGKKKFYEEVTRK